jgi:nucleotide-binding universal stress UspA family protein
MATEGNNIILVPTDFSDTCQRAIDYAVNIASYNSLKVALLHVINKETKAKLKKEKQGLESVLNRLNELKIDITEKFNVEVDVIAREGSIFEVINDVAKEINPRWMALGTHGKKGLQYIFGSYALKLVTQTACPVVVVQKESQIAIPRKILFPVNLYNEPRQQVQYAVMAAKRFKSTIYIYKQKFNDSGEASRVDIITEQIEETFKQENIDFVTFQAEKQANFTEQLLDFAEDNEVNSLLMMTNSSIDNPDFNHTHWSESLIYNEKAIPVFCINPVYLGQIYFSL